MRKIEVIQRVCEKVSGLRTRDSRGDCTDEMMGGMGFLRIYEPLATVMRRLRCRRNAGDCSNLIVIICRDGVRPGDSTSPGLMLRGILDAHYCKNLSIYRNWL